MHLEIDYYCLHFRFFGTGPATHYFYRYLAAAVKPTDKNSNVIKLTIERLFFAPSFLLLFFYSIPLLEVRNFFFSTFNFHSVLSV